MTSTAQAEAGAHRGPFERFGWLMWVAWLGFLVFPVTGAISADATAWARWATAGTVVVFGVVYAVGTARLIHPVDCPRRESTLVLALLVAMSLAALPVLGVGILAFFPFLIAFGVFALPRPACWWWLGLLLAIGLPLPVLVLQIEEWGWFGLILVGVSGGTAGGRLMADHDVEHSRVREELTVVGERARVARDVHDGLGHSLTVVSVKAELAGRLLDVDLERARGELAEIQTMTREALAELRATVSGLRETRLEDELERAGQALRSAGIDSVLPLEADVVDPRRRTVAAWVLREAVTNVVRHSGATSCEVELHAQRVVVSDDGCGSEHLIAGRGLRGLRERVEHSGGRLAVSRSPRSGGTVLEVAW